MLHESPPIIFVAYKNYKLEAVYTNLFREISKNELNLVFKLFELNEVSNRLVYQMLMKLEIGTNYIKVVTPAWYCVAFQN